ncbi:DUF2262 domain-containing protein [Humibacter sp. BT305]|nr:DUF2262 domain-containing protein [Humibacter sp. BT305]
MSELQERIAFDARYASDPVELVVLTGRRVGGAGRARGEELWTASADVLAYIDENDAMIWEKGLLWWLADEVERVTSTHDLQALTQYRVRVRRATPDPAAYAKHNLPMPDLSHHFALDEVTARDIQSPDLQERLERWLRPVRVTADIGEFELNRSFGSFVGSVRLGVDQVLVHLDVDDVALEGSESCTRALARLEQILSELPTVELRWRQYAASNLTELANEWRHGTEAVPRSEIVSTERFAQQIRLKELAVESDGSVFAYYDDGELLTGHVILIDIEADGTMSGASIAG